MWSQYASLGGRDVPKPYVVLDENLQTFNGSDRTQALQAKQEEYFERCYLNPIGMQHRCILFVNAENSRLRIRSHIDLTQQRIFGTFPLDKESKHETRVLTQVSQFLRSRNWPTQ